MDGILIAAIVVAMVVAVGRKGKERHPDVVDDADQPSVTSGWRWGSARTYGWDDIQIGRDPWRRW